MSTRRKILLAPEQARYRTNDITFEPSGGASSARSRVRMRRILGWAENSTASIHHLL